MMLHNCAITEQNTSLHTSAYLISESPTQKSPHLLSACISAEINCMALDSFGWDVVLTSSAQAHFIGLWLYQHRQTANQFLPAAHILFISLSRRGKKIIPYLSARAQNNWH